MLKLLLLIERNTSFAYKLFDVYCLDFKLILLLLFVIKDNQYEMVKCLSQKQTSIFCKSRSVNYSNDKSVAGTTIAVAKLPRKPSRANILVARLTNHVIKWDDQNGTEYRIFRHSFHFHFNFSSFFLLYLSNSNNSGRHSNSMREAIFCLFGKILSLSKLFLKNISSGKSLRYGHNFVSHV